MCLAKGMSVAFAQGKDNNTLMAYAVNVQLGEWKAKLDFIIVPMDSIKEILGLTWFHQYVISLYGKGMIMVMLGTTKGEA